MASTVPNQYHSGRRSRLEDPDFLQQVAECFAAGMTREDMAAALNVGSLVTITRWRRDARVKDAVRKILQERVQRVVAKTDAEISARLSDPSGLTIKELLEIRKEFATDALRTAMNEVDEDTVNEAAEFFERNPDAAEELRKLLAGGATGSREA